jgi:hypothetical protein
MCPRIIADVLIESRFSPGTPIELEKLINLAVIQM